MAASTDNNQESNSCIICGEEVEGKMMLYTGFVNYEVAGGGGITHSCKTQQFYEARSRKAKSKPKQVEQALERLLLNPKDKKAIATLQEWRSRRLFDLATDPKAGYAGLRAADQLIREFAGEEQSEQGEYVPPQPEIVVTIAEPPLSRPAFNELKDHKEIIIDDDIEEVREATAVDNAEDVDEWEAVEHPWPDATIWPDGSTTAALSRAEVERSKRPVNPYSIKGLSG